MAHGFLTPTPVSGDRFWQNARWLWEKFNELKKRKAPPEEVVPVVVTGLQNALPPGKQKLLPAAKDKLLTGTNQKALPPPKAMNMLKGSSVTGALTAGKSEIVIKQQLALPPGGPKLPPAGGVPGVSNPKKSAGFVNMPGVASTPKKLDADAFFKAAQTGVDPETGRYLSSDERKNYLKKSKSKLNAPTASASAGIAGAGSASSLGVVTKGEELTVEAIQQMGTELTKVVTNLVDATKEQTKQQKLVGEKATAIAEKSSSRALAASKERDLEQGKDLSSSISPTYGTGSGRLGGAAGGGLLGGALGLGANFLGGKVAAKAAGKFGVKQAQKFGIKAGAGAAAKMLGKKIPILGFGLGGIFAAQRALAGDYTGAGMELASGAASTLPGLGTAGSLGIDAALAARDAGVTPFATGGIITEPTLSLMGENRKKEGVFPLEGKEGDKVFMKFGEGIIDAQKQNRTEYSKIQSAGLKQYYERDGGSKKLGETIADKFKGFDWGGLNPFNRKNESPTTPTNTPSEQIATAPSNPATHLGSSPGQSKDLYTLAAISSLESGSAQGRADVAQSVYNRLRDKTYKGKSIHDILTKDGQYQPAFIDPKATRGAGTRVSEEFKNIQTEDDAIKAIQSYYKKRGQTVSDATARKMVKETISAIKNPDLQARAAAHVGGRTDFLGYDANLNAQVSRGGATHNYFGAEYGNKSQNLRLGAAAVPSSLFATATTPPNNRQNNPSMQSAAAAATQEFKGSNAVFGETGRVFNAKGYVHGHFQSNTGTRQDVIKDVNRVVRGLLNSGVKDVSITSGETFTKDMSDAQINNLIEKGLRKHTHSGDGRSVDIFVPKGTRVPFPLTDVRTAGGNEGRSGILPGTGHTWVGHLTPNSQSGGGSSSPMIAREPSTSTPANTATLAAAITNTNTSTAAPPPDPEVEALLGGFNPLKEDEVSPANANTGNSLNAASVATNQPRNTVVNNNTTVVNQGGNQGGSTPSTGLSAGATVDQVVASYKRGTFIMRMGT